MVVGVIGMWGVHVIDTLVSVKCSKLSSRMLLLYTLNSPNFPKIQRMNFMAHIKSLNCARHSQSDINILISMATDVEITRNLFHREATSQSTTILFRECLLSHLELTHLIGFA